MYHDLRSVFNEQQYRVIRNVFIMARNGIIMAFCLIVVMAVEFVQCREVVIPERFLLTNKLMPTAEDDAEIRDDFVRDSAEAARFVRSADEVVPAVEEDVVNADDSFGDSVEAARFIRSAGRPSSTTPSANSLYHPCYFNNVSCFGK